MNTPKFQYDVVFSLAGEQKDYVKKIANYLRKHNLKVWFYEFEQVDLWGKDLIDALSEIFTMTAKYCVIFISKEYTQKVWPNLERRFIQSRWLKDPNYLLPARFDDSLVIGIPDTIGYISLQNLSPEEFGEMIIAKIRNDTSKAREKPPSFRVPKVKQDFNPLDVRNGWIFYLIEELKKRSKQITDMEVAHDEIEGVVHLKIIFKGRTTYSLNIYKKAYFPGDDGISFYGVGGEIKVLGEASNASGKFVWNKDKSTVVLKLLDMSLLENMPGERELTKEEFIDELWSRICDVIERDY